MATWEQVSNKANGDADGWVGMGKWEEQDPNSRESVIIRRLQGTTPTRAGCPGGGASLRCLGLVFVSLISKFSVMTFNFF